MRQKEKESGERETKRKNEKEKGVETERRRDSERRGEAPTDPGQG